MTYLQRKAAGIPEVRYNYGCVEQPYTTVTFSKSLTIDSSRLAREGELWGVFCEFQVLIVSCACHCQTNVIYRKASNIRHTLAGNKIVDHSDVVGASPVEAAPTTSSFSI